VDAQFGGRRKRQPKIKATVFLECPITKFLFAYPALSAVLRAVLAIFAILAGVAGIGTSAGRRENVEGNLINEQNGQ